MSFVISDFLAKLKSHESLARNNKFEVIIYDSRSISASDVQDLRFFAEQVNMPGVAYHLHETKRYGYGPSEKRPFDMVFPEVTAVFVLTQDSYAYKFFYKWFSLISPYNTSDGLGTTTYLFEYKDAYSAPIDIKMYKTNGEEMLTLKLREAYPIVLNDIPLAWADHNNKIALAVQFAYIDWHIENFETTR